MNSTEAARRLGVKVETLYAYVSRGILERQTGPDGRSSRFDAREVEQLARRGRPRQSSRSTSLNMLIETHLTSLSQQGVRYRGELSADLARTHTFEEVAELLWLGRLPSASETWHGDTWSVEAWPSRRAGVACPQMGLPDAIRLVAAMAATGTTGVVCKEPGEVGAAGRRLIATIVDSLPFVGDGRTPRLVLPAGGQPIRSTIAGRVWTKVAARRPAPGMLGVVNAALVLLADHELAASTLAVRVAASTHAHPYAAVGAGLGALSGPLHGGASTLARQLMDDAADVGATRAVTAVLRSGARIPGFGHRVYSGADPRAVLLLDLLRRVTGHTRAISIVDDLLEAVSKRIDHPLNVDFALAAMGFAGNMLPDSGEAIMAIARIAGWLAHAIEEYAEVPLRFRPRASYIGP